MAKIKPITTTTPQPFIPNLEAIKQIESSGNPTAFNKGSGARGLFQITPVVLKEWNQKNPKEKYSTKQLFDPEVNTKIAGWYLDRLANHYAPHYGIEPTTENILGMYNWGMGNVKKLKEGKIKAMPPETTNYIKKYNLLSSGTAPLAPSLVTAPAIAKEVRPTRRGSGKTIGFGKELM